MTGRRVLIFFVAFFLVIIVVNGIFMLAALRTHKGVVTENAYEEGLNYEEPQESTAQQTAPTPQSLVSDEFVWNGSLLQWRIRNPEGRGVRFATATVTLTHVDSNQAPITLDLKANGHGVYQVAPEKLKSGEWIVDGTAKFGINGRNINHNNQTTITVE